METRNLNAALEAEVSSAGEKFARLVDAYVMAVTEGLCSLEHQAPGVMTRPGISDRKARILQGLDVLDGLLTEYRERITPDGAFPSLPESLRGF